MVLYIVHADLCQDGLGTVRPRVIRPRTIRLFIVKNSV